MLGSIAAGALLIPLVVLRSVRHPAPVIEPALFRIRSFAVANGGMLVFSFAFYAVILANILFLTGVWGWSVLDAGLAVTPAPLMAALAAPLAGRQVGRWGPRPIAMAGAALFAAGAGWYALYLDATPDYAAEFLPGALMGGTGVGLSFASWGAASVSELPASRFATGAAVTSTLRQLGAVLGIAVLIAVLEAGSPADPVGAFDDAYLVMGIASLAGVFVALGLGGLKPLAAATDLRQRIGSPAADAEAA